MQTLPFTPQSEAADDTSHAESPAAMPQYDHLGTADHPAPADPHHGYHRSASRPILIVEDDRGLSTMLALALEDARYTVDIAENGADALERLKTIRPRLILLDLRMPIMDGPAFLREIYEHAPLAEPLPPIIIMTAYGDIDPDVSKLGLPSIIKPMKIDVLLQIIQQYAEAE
jgi:CheY-like chemotaxis protein